MNDISNLALFLKVLVLPHHCSEDFSTRKRLKITGQEIINFFKTSDSSDIDKLFQVTSNKSIGSILSNAINKITAVSKKVTDQLDKLYDFKNPDQNENFDHNYKNLSQLYLHQLNSLTNLLKSWTSLSKTIRDLEMRRTDSLKKMLTDINNFYNTKPEQ